MSTKWKIFLGSLAALFVAIVIWVVYTTPEAPVPIEKIEAPKIMSYGGNTLTEEKDGVKIWDLTAESMEVDTTTQDVMMTNLTGHFYQKDGNTVELKAKHGIYNQLTKQVHVNDEVVVTTKDQAKLTCDTLDWVGAEEILIAEGKVKVTKDDMLAEGDRMEVKDGFQHLMIQGNAHIVKGVKQDETRK